jgi:hypothetical protein
MKRSPFDATTRIPFKVVEGKLVHIYGGGEITELRNGAIGDIVVKTMDLTDEGRLKQYNSEKIVDFLPKGAKLRARVKIKSVPEALKSGFLPVSTEPDKAYVEIILQQDLQLHLRVTKDARLMPCSCLVPSLVSNKEDGVRISVNETYSLISTHYEPHRRSHSGNVFNEVFYCLQAPISSWQPLRDLRDKKQAESEDELLKRAIGPS